MNIKKLQLIGISLVLFFGLSFATSAKFNIDVDRTYEVQADGRMLVREERIISNKTENSYLASSENMTFQILGFRMEDSKGDEVLQQALNSVRIVEGGRTVEFSSVMEENSILLRVPYGRDLLPGQSRQLTLTYEHPGLLSKNGAILDAYIHAFAADFDFETATTNHKFSTKLMYPSLLPPLNFVVPQPSSKLELNGKTVYEFSQESLVDQFVWLQLGKQQVYKFKISQNITPTDTAKTGLINRYEVVIPRNFSGPEITQEVYFENISPDPAGVYADEQGNLIGVFEFESDKEVRVEINGYAEVKIDDAVIGETNSGELEDIPESLINTATGSSEFWEVDSLDIQQKAAEISPTDLNIYDITKKFYSFVVDSIDYSEVKRFGINDRQGALATLRGGAAVCMEYSDLFLTLMRAKGIPTRAVFGYGYDPRVASDSQEPHQWVQVYMPGVENNWVDVDVTWGESGDVMIGGDLNHFYTHVASKSPEDPAMVSRFAYGNGGSLELPEFEIETLETVPVDYRLLSTPDGLIESHPYINESEAEFLKRQFVSIYKAGASSILDGIDFNNTSQVIVLGSFVFLGLVMGGIVEVMVKRKK